MMNTLKTIRSAKVNLDVSKIFSLPQNMAREKLVEYLRKVHTNMFETIINIQMQG